MERELLVLISNHFLSNATSSGHPLSPYGPKVSVQGCRENKDERKTINCGLCLVNWLHRVELAKVLGLADDLKKF